MTQLATPPEPLIQTGEPFPGWSFYQPQKWIRVSAVSTYISCPRKFFYHYGCGLVESGYRLALTFGEAIHASLGWLLQHPGDLAGSILALDKVWLLEHEAQADPKRNKNNAVRIILQWMSQHTPGLSIYEAIAPPKSLSAGGLVPTETQSDWEVPFAIDIGVGIPLVGRIDALAKHRDTGALWTVEFKTVSQLTSLFLDGFKLNTQAICYNIACRSHGLPTVGTFVEALETKGPLKTKESPPPKIMTHPVYIPDHVLSDGIKMLKWKVQEMLEFEKRGFFPKLFTGCNPYGSFGIQGFNCDYTRLCLTEDWTSLKDTFKVDRDIPFIVKPTVEGEKI